MDSFTKLTGVAAPMPLVNIDTDMIIPKQFLKTIKRSGLGVNLFDEMRYDDDGNEVQAHGPDTTGEWYDKDKREAAIVFRKAWKSARENSTYKSLKAKHISGELYKNKSLKQYA